MCPVLYSRTPFVCPLVKVLLSLKYWEGTRFALHAHGSHPISDNPTLSPQGSHTAFSPCSTTSCSSRHRRLSTMAEYHSGCPRQTTKTSRSPCRATPTSKWSPSVYKTLANVCAPFNYLASFAPFVSLLTRTTHRVPTTHNLPAHTRRRGRPGGGQGMGGEDQAGAVGGRKDSRRAEQFPQGLL